MSILEMVLGYWAFALGAIVLLLLFLNAFRYIPNAKVGIQEKLWSFGGSVERGIIALNGEAGYQPDVLRGGWHVLVPLQYRIHMLPIVTIPQGKIGYVFARDGALLPASQTLAANVATHDFEDAAAFLREGGQKGPQRKILREGSYAINLAQFAVITGERVLFLPLERR